MELNIPFCLYIKSASYTRSVFSFSNKTTKLLESLVSQSIHKVFINMFFALQVA